MSQLFTWENAGALITLIALEITLGIDNIVFIAIITGRLPEKIRNQARRIGLIGAMGTRVVLLLGIAWVMRLVQPLFSVMGHAVSGRDLILIIGGLFLVGKATFEIHDKIEGPPEHHAGAAHEAANFRGAVVQIMILDIIFSLDSVITAVGMSSSIPVMVAAIVAAVGVMMFFAGSVSDFIEHHPTMKMLALSFLILIGVVLVAEGFGRHIPRGYIYFSMAFSLLVEMLNIRVRKIETVAKPREMGAR
jgi:predicted tellurium resistance membrane protein TerC